MVSTEAFVSVAAATDLGDHGRHRPPWPVEIFRDFGVALVTHFSLRRKCATKSHWHSGFFFDLYCVNFCRTSPVPRLFHLVVNSK
jgi:hypothetical protein